MIISPKPMSIPDEIILVVNPETIDASMKLFDRNGATMTAKTARDEKRVSSLSFVLLAFSTKKGRNKRGKALNPAPIAKATPD